MELFLELSFTIAVSLLCCFFLAKFLSIASSATHQSWSTPSPCPDVIDKDRNPGVQQESGDPETEIRVHFLEKSLLVSESEGRMVLGQCHAEEPLVEDGGSARTSGDDEVGVSGNVGVAGLKLMEDIREKCCEEMVGSYSDCAHNVIDESPERVEVREIDIEVDGMEEGLLDDDDGDWEGIERTELERKFGAAVVFVCSGRNADQVLNLISTDVQMQLYGLHKIVIHGQCLEAQPMALKVSARAKWNAWQQLGNMSPEVAMEQYITLLSKSIPGWEHANPGDTK